MHAAIPRAVAAVSFRQLRHRLRRRNLVQVAFATRTSKFDSTFSGVLDHVAVLAELRRLAATFSACSPACRHCTSSNTSQVSARAPLPSTFAGLPSPRTHARCKEGHGRTDGGCARHLATCVDRATVRWRVDECKRFGATRSSSAPPKESRDSCPGDESDRSLANSSPRQKEE